MPYHPDEERVELKGILAEFEARLKRKLIESKRAVTPPRYSSPDDRLKVMVRPLVSL